MKPSYQRLESLDVLRFFVVLLACAVGGVLFVGLGDAALHVYGGRVDAVHPFPI